MIAANIGKKPSPGNNQTFCIVEWIWKVNSKQKQRFVCIKLLQNNMGNDRRLHPSSLGIHMQEWIPIDNLKETVINKSNSLLRFVKNFMLACRVPCAMCHSVRDPISSECIQLQWSQAFIQTFGYDLSFVSEFIV